jgi:hypothetical protein
VSYGSQGTKTERLTTPGRAAELVVEEEFSEWEDDKGNVRQHTGYVATWTTVVLQCDSPTPAGRTYPKKVMESAIAEYAPLIAGKRAFGAVEPAGQRGLAHGMIELASVAFMVERLEIYTDNSVVIRIRTLATPEGRMLASVFHRVIQDCKAGNKARTAEAIPLRVVPVGFGSESCGSVNSDYRLVGFSVVLVPVQPEPLATVAAPPEPKSTLANQPPFTD